MWFDLTHHAVWAATETAQAGLRRFVQVEAAPRYPDLAVLHSLQ
jgi:hypothetical protein